VNTIKDRGYVADKEHAFGMPQYPIDISTLLDIEHLNLDAAGVPYHTNDGAYYPTTIAQYALALWNQHLTTDDDRHRCAFLIQAYWLVEHETRIGEACGGWPVSLPHPDIHTRGPWLSALTQGNSISVLARAYRLTHEDVFLEVAHRAVRTFHQDILDGGVSAPVGENGVFFEEIAAYPAAHMLSGFILALFGLYDYVALTGDVRTERLIFRSLATMHSLLDEFDVGFWTRSDLLHRHLASPAHLELQAELLEALAKYSGCEHCKALALRWKSYSRHVGSRLHYLISSGCSSFIRALLSQVRIALFPELQVSRSLRICVPIDGFPVAGGMCTVLAGVAQVMADTWQLEYLTQYVGPNSTRFIIHRFGTAKMHPWQFPAVWLYFLAGFRKLFSLVRYGANYQVILPQDGIVTGTFAALVAKLAGVRVVCIDHGNLALVKSSSYRIERIQALETKDWSRLRRLLARLEYVWYWPSIYLLARISVSLVDHFLIPGAAGDGVEEACRELGIHSSRITRFVNMIDMDRHVIPDAESRAAIREKNGIAAGAIVITMICRLAPEKGLDLALEAISRALAALSPALRACTRVLIVGDGPLRKQVEADIRIRKLSQICMLWGEASAEDVVTLLSLSDIFLFTSRRASGYPLAILEAMASGCSVIASAEPLANSRMLANGRGIVVPVGDVEQFSRALVQLLNDQELCHQMGSLARHYVATQHSGALLRRALMRVTCWSALDTILDCGKKD